MRGPLSNRDVLGAAILARVLHIRTAALEDLDTLRSLWHELEAAQGGFRVLPMVSDGEGRVMASFADAISSPEGDVLLAFDGEDPVAMALIRVERPSRMSDGRVVEMSRVVVRDGRRGGGIGRALVDAAAAWARERGIGTLMAGIFVANDASRRFWAAAGFEPWVERRLRPVD